MAQLKNFKDQDYQVLAEQHDSNRLFTDPEFSPCCQSISHTGNLMIPDDVSGDNAVRLIEWRRPHVRWTIINRQDVDQKGSGCYRFTVAASQRLLVTSDARRKSLPFAQVFWHFVLNWSPKSYPMIKLSKRTDTQVCARPLSSPIPSCC